MDIRKLKIYFQTKTDFLDDFLPKGSLCGAERGCNTYWTLAALQSKIETCGFLSFTFILGQCV